MSQMETSKRSAQVAPTLYDVHFVHLHNQIQCSSFVPSGVVLLAAAAAGTTLVILMLAATLSRKCSELSKPQSQARSSCRDPDTAVNTKVDLKVSRSPPH